MNLLFKLKKLFSFNYRIFKLTNKDELLLNLRVLKNDRNSKVYPIWFFKRVKPISINVNLNDIYISRIDNCYIIGESNIIILGRKIFYDYLFLNYGTNINVTDNGFLFIFRKPAHINKYYIVKYYD